MKKIRSFLIISIIISFVIGGLAGLVSSLLIINWSVSFDSRDFFKTNGLTNLAVKDVLEEKKVDLAILKSDSEKLVEVVKKSAPAVVSITVSQDVKVSVVPFEGFFEGNDFPFDLKIELPEQQSKPDSRSNKQPVGTGSGFIISSDGLILTNKHVVDYTDAEYSVVMNNGKKYPAIVLAKDQFLDIALIKIEAKNLPTLAFGNSDKLEIGQTVVAIGNALGEYQNTVTAGIISGIKRRVVAGDGMGLSEVIEGAIQIDAAINPGNSGGPLLNLSGAVVGINTAVNQGGQSVAFALPINSVKTIVESVKKYGHIVRPWLGVRYILLNQEIAEKEKLSLDYGALVLKGKKTTEVAIVPGSPADKAGIAENDVILKVNGQKVIEENGLSALINKYQVGDEITLKIWRKGEIKDIKIKLEEAISK